MFTNYRKSMFYHRKYNIEYTKPVLKVAYMFALCPPCSFTKGKRINVYIYKLYAISIGTLIFFLALSSAGLRCMFIYPKDDLIHVIIDIVKQFLQLAFALVAMYGNALWNYKKYFKVIDHFVQVDKVNRNKMNVQTTPRNFVVYEIVLAMLFITVIVILDVLVRLQDISFFVMSAYLLEKLMCYVVIIFILLMYNFVTSVKFRFERICEDIWEMDTSIPKITLNSITDFSEEAKNENLLKTRQLKLSIRNYTKLTDLVWSLNEIFGWEIVILDLLIVVAMLECVSISIANAGNLNAKMYLIIINLIWSATYMVIGIILASSFDAATGQAKRVGTISYKVLNNIFNIVKANSFREKLHFLAQHAATKYPYFTAAGFFKVDLTMLFTILGTFTSYIVVILQFNKGKI